MSTISDKIQDIYDQKVALRQLITNSGFTPGKYSTYPNTLSSIISHLKDGKDWYVTHMTMQFTNGPFEYIIASITPHIEDESIVIDWGDGVTNEYHGSLTDVKHTYKVGGVLYNITIYNATMHDIYFGTSATMYSNKIHSITLDGTSFKDFHEIKDYAFCGFIEMKSLNIDVLGEINSVGVRAFSQGGLSSLDLSNLKLNVDETTALSTEAVKQEAFYGMQNLVELNLQNYNGRLGQSAIKECKSLTNLIIPKVKVLLGNSVSYNQSLRNLNLEDCEMIGTQGCIQNRVLEYVRLPNLNKHNETYYTLRQQAFYGCSNLSVIDFRDRQVNTIPKIQPGLDIIANPELSPFAHIKEDYKIVVPDSMYDSWIIAPIWSDIAEHIIKASDYND